ncbi:hypothetical protein [Pseudorhodoferax sp.]|uniref:hypothetical protein n=1 Tax=Pseudorhodoferax sp. TaxID=1993553 RepID=UPI0039E4AD63
MRAIALPCLCLAATAAAWAQAPAAEGPSAPGIDKRIERIHVEDEGARIDELRVGGEAQSLRVEPRNSALPAYEIVPNNGARVRPGNERDAAPGNAGQRVWKVLGF